MCYDFRVSRHSGEDIIHEYFQKSSNTRNINVLDYM